MKRNTKIGFIGLLLVCVLMCTSCTSGFFAKIAEEWMLHNETESDVPLSATCSHQFGEWCVEKEATCEADGSRTRVCARCEGTQREAIPATGHREIPMADVPASCEYSGSIGGTYCEACSLILKNATEVPPTGHPAFQNGICTACGVLENGSVGSEHLDLYNQSYGYEYLGTMINGRARQRFYEKIDDIIRKFHTDPSMNAVRKSDRYDPVASTLKYSDFGLTLEDALEVWKTYRDDNPLYYWMSTTVVYDDISETISLLVYEEYAYGGQRIETNKSLYRGIAAYLSAIPAKASDYEIALLMHDKIISSISYATDASGEPETASWAHNIIGVFEGRGAVCEGYARAYQLLLNMKGVDCLLVTGSGKDELHAWNMIRLWDDWYGVDLTWDDNGSDIYEYFCLSEAEFYQSHTKADPTYEGIDFLYEVPELAEYSIEWVELYQGDARIGLFTCIDSALDAMNLSNGDYTVRLLEDGGTLLHKTSAYHIYGEFPDVKSLTIVGVYTPQGNNYYSATVLYLTKNMRLKSDLTLKNLFLVGKTTVRLTKGNYALKYGTNPYHSVIKSGIYLT